MAAFTALIEAMQNLEAFKALVREPKKVVITTHHKPDADALGSSLGLSAFLKKLGHTVTVVSPTDYPKFLHWMPSNADVLVYTENPALSAEKIAEAEIIFCLDFSAISRINELGPLVLESKAKKVMVDHHLQPESFSDFSLWSTGAAATAELIYDLIVLLEQTDKIDHDIANCLYAGLMTDTGGFRHPNTNAKVHYTIAHLIEHGANPTEVNSRIYENNTEARLHFLGYSLQEKLVVLPEFHTAFIWLTQDEIKKFQSETGDTEGFVNYALSLQGIVMGAIIIDRAEAIKMSFRSVGNFSVNDFARKHFNGGGHKNAAGGRSNDTLEATVEKFVALLETYKEALLEASDSHL